jgi:hypothetical protein
MAVALIDSTDAALRAADAIKYWRDSVGTTPTMGLDLEWHIDDSEREQGVVAKSTRPCFVQVALFGTAEVMAQVTSRLDLTGDLRSAGRDPSGRRLEVFAVCLIFDAITLPSEAIHTTLNAILRDGGVRKLVWDVREDAYLLKKAFGIRDMKGFIDVQLLHLKSCRGPTRFKVPTVTGLARALEELISRDHVQAKAELDLKVVGSACFTQRPVRPEVAAYAAADVLCLYEMFLLKSAELRNNHGRNLDACMREIAQGTEFMQTYSESVPWQARRHGGLVVGVLPSVLPVPKNAVRCQFCTRVVAPYEGEDCDTCRFAQTPKPPRR